MGWDLGVVAAWRYRLARGELGRLPQFRQRLGTLRAVLLWKPPKGRRKGCAQLSSRRDFGRDAPVSICTAAAFIGGLLALTASVRGAGPAPGCVKPLLREDAVLVDMSRESERVLAHELLGEVGVASLKRADDRNVLADGLRGAVVLPERHCANGADMDE